MNTIVQEIIKGSVDLHVEGSPGPSEERLDVLEIAKAAYELEIGSFVYKSEYHPTAATASIMQQMYPGLKIIGSIVINAAIGGINPSAVEASAQLGAKVVWVPPPTARESQLKQCMLYTNEGILSDNSLETLEVIASHEMTLISELRSSSETITLFNEATKRGVSRIVASNSIGALSIQDQLEISSCGAYIEHTFSSCMPTVGKISTTEVARSIQSVGADRCIVTTGLGQWFNPIPAEGFRMAIASLLHSGLNADQVSMLVKGNPKSLLD